MLKTVDNLGFAAVLEIAIEVRRVPPKELAMWLWKRELSRCMCHSGFHGIHNKTQHAFERDLNSRHPRNWHQTCLLRYRW